MAYKGTMSGDALICLVCGALVDNALVDEHDRFHESIPAGPGSEKVG